MYRQSSAAFLFITYAALTVGLLVTSFLSPIHYRTVGDRSLRVYAVVVVYDSPPPSGNWTPDPSDSSSSHSSSSSAHSTSSLDSSSAHSSSWLDSRSSSHPDSEWAPTNLDGLAAPRWLNGDGAAPVYTLVSDSAFSAATALTHGGNSDTALYSLQRLRTDAMALWQQSSGDYPNTRDHPVRPPSDAAPSTEVKVEDSISGGGGEESSSDENIIRRHRVAVRNLRSIRLGRLMVVYITFAGTSCVCAIAVICASMLHLVPDAQWIKLSVVSVTLFAVSVLCNLVCVVVGVVMVRNDLYQTIGKGYYARTFEIGYKEGISSGLSSAIASLVLSVISVVVIFLFRRQ